MTGRRKFVGQLGALAAAMSVAGDELHAASDSSQGMWDTTWLDRLAAAKYRVVFNASEVSDGDVLSHAASFFEDYRTVHGTTDRDTRPVIVFRRGGTPMAVNDHLWQTYAIGESLKLKDPETHAVATRNVFWKARKGASGWEADTALESLQKRGLISLVCNIALGNWARRWAESTNRDPESVLAEARANLIPGAILVPSGIYGLIRAQNAGCAYMPGS
jgi:intracellular sulfur oxidation DsrE/DsrF family protein